MSTKLRRLQIPLAAFSLALALGAPRLASAQEQQPNLDDVEFDQVVKPGEAVDADKLLAAWAAKLHVLIVVDQQMAGTKIKFLVSDLKLTWGLFKKVLDFNDIVLDEKESNKRWIMFAHLRRNLAGREAPPFPFVPVGQEMPKREQVVTAVIQVIHGAGNDIFATVRGLLVRDVNRIGNILYVRGPEVIIIVDFAQNVEYYTKIIRALDVQAPGQVTRVIQVQFAPAEDIVRVIQAVLRPAGPGGGPQPAGPVVAPGAGGNLAAPQIIADPRTNKLIIQAYAYQFDEINRMIGELDIRTPVKPPKFHVYKCKFVDADYLAGKLSELFTGQHGGSGGGSRRSSSGGGAGGAQGAGGGARGGAAGGGGAVSLSNPQGQQGGTGKSDFSVVETRVVPDELSNSLLIQAEEPVYKQILSILEGNPEQGQGLDHPRRRVLIEGQIWEISTPQDDLTIGFELADVTNAAQGKFRPAGLTDFGLSNVSVDTNAQRLTRIPNLTQGVTAVLTKDTFDKLPIIMNAVATLEHSRLITTPFALTNDNQEATFEIDDKIPYQTSTLAGTGLAQSNVQTIDVKTSLKITPQVNSDENLTLDVTIELGTIGAQGSAGLPPTTNTRTYSGVVTIPNMKYIVFGGLESEQNGDVETKVPWLGDIPILGHLFKQKSWTHTTTKIYVFMRACIFVDDAGLERFGQDLRQKAHIQAERDEWLPPIANERVIRAPWKTVQDTVFDVFGTGSANPLNLQPKDE